METTRVTPWHKEPYRRFRQAVTEIDDLLALSTRAIGHTPLVLATMRMLSAPDEYGEKASFEFPAEAAKKYEQLVELASQEVERGFPLFHAQALVGIWSSLEAGLYDLAALIVLHDSTAGHNALAKITGPLREFASLGEAERADYLVNELRLDLRSDQKLGVGQFESIFDELGLGGSLEDVMKRDILELQQLRHIIVHRAGTADEILVKRCPWISARDGNQIAISAEQYRRLAQTGINYFLLITRRAGKRYTAT